MLLKNSQQLLAIRSGHPSVKTEELQIQVTIATAVYNGNQQCIKFKTVDTGVILDGLKKPQYPGKLNGLDRIVCNTAIGHFY